MDDLNEAPATTNLYIDTRGDFKVSNFGGDDAQWPTLSLKAEAYCTLGWGDMMGQAALQAAAAEQGQVPPRRLLLLGSRVKHGGASCKVHEGGATTAPSLLRRGGHAAVQGSEHGRPIATGSTSKHLLHCCPRPS